MNAEDEFETDLPERGTDEPALVVDVEGFEGPLDLLLTLARQQKVDLAKISILALADQYLAFIEAARKMRLELAADYLVMAAWLAYLKSRLLLPEQHPAGGMSAEDMANALAQRLRREIDAQLPRDLGPWLGQLGALRREVRANAPAGEARNLLLHELAQRRLCGSSSCPTRRFAEEQIREMQKDEVVA